MCFDANSDINLEFGRVPSTSFQRVFGKINHFVE